MPDNETIRDQSAENLFDLTVLEEEETRLYQAVLEEAGLAGQPMPEHYPPAVTAKLDAISRRIAERALAEDDERLIQELGLGDLRSDPEALDHALSAANARAGEIAGIWNRELEPPNTDDIAFMRSYVSYRLPLPEDPKAAAGILLRRFAAQGTYLSALDFSSYTGLPIKTRSDDRARFRSV